MKVCIIILAIIGAWFAGLYCGFIRREEEVETLKRKIDKLKEFTEASDD